MRKTLRAGIVALAIATTTFAAGCSSTGGRPASTGDNGGGGATADTPRVTIAMITHAPPGDTFWDLVRKGAETAAKKDNFELRYSNDPDAPAQANLVQNAIDSKVAGIAVTLAKPDAMRAAVKAAQTAGIPVVALNAGVDVWKQMGITQFFGVDDRVGGQQVGERLSAEGKKKAICVNPEQGHVALEARCAGIAEKFSGSTENLNVLGTDLTQVTSTITSKLQQDPSIDAVVGLGAPNAIAAVQAAKDAGSKATIVSFDTNADMVSYIKDGQIEWAIDQQPFLQGYLAIDSLWLQLNYGNTIGGGNTVYTGPSFIDKDNIDSVAKFVQAGYR